MKSIINDQTTWTLQLTVEYGGNLTLNQRSLVQNPGVMIALSADVTSRIFLCISAETRVCWSGFTWLLMAKIASKRRRMRVLITTTYSLFFLHLHGPLHKLGVIEILVGILCLLAEQALKHVSCPLQRVLNGIREVLQGTDRNGLLWGIL